MLFNNLFSREEPQIKTVYDFWNWFTKQEQQFYFQAKANLENATTIINTILNKVHEYNPSIYGLIGFCDEDTLELVFTSDGIVKDFVFAKEFVDKAPLLPNWKFTYLKPETHFDFAIDWKEFSISKDNIWFYPTIEEGFSDEININLVYEHYENETGDKEIINGLLVFLDNCLGELNMATKIDFIDLIPKNNIPSGTDLIPIEKIKSYLIWREKEFLQKYDQTSYPLNTIEEFSFLEAEDQNLPFYAVINTSWSIWPYKPVYSWCAKVVLHYQGNDYGIPDTKQLNEIQEFEGELLNSLNTFEICHIGRATFDHKSTIYLYSNEYLNFSKIIYDQIESTNNSLNIDYQIFRDKYWRLVSDFF